MTNSATQTAATFGVEVTQTATAFVIRRSRKCFVSTDALTTEQFAFLQSLVGRCVAKMTKAQLIEFATIGKVN